MTVYRRQVTVFAEDCVSA